MQESWVSDEGLVESEVDSGKEEFSVKSNIEELEEQIGTQSHLEPSGHAGNSQTFHNFSQLFSCGNDVCSVSCVVMCDYCSKLLKFYA